VIENDVFDVETPTGKLCLIVSLAEGQITRVQCAAKEIRPADPEEQWCYQGYFSAEAFLSLAREHPLLGQVGNWAARGVWAGEAGREARVFEVYQNDETVYVAVVEQDTLQTVIARELETIFTYLAGQAHPPGYVMQHHRRFTAEEFVRFAQQQPGLDEIKDWTRLHEMLEEAHPPTRKQLGQWRLRKREKPDK